jgi:hypothetical protein
LSKYHTGIVIFSIHKWYCRVLVLTP